MENKPIILILHHDDADGQCAAAIAAACYDQGDFDIKFIALNYGKEPWPIPEIEEADEVWMFDFTSEFMASLVEMLGNKLVWIDHHKTAMEKFPDLWNSDVMGIRSLDKAACELTWKYFHGGDAQIPWAVNYIGDRDMWKFNYESTRAFCAGFNAMVNSPDNYWWNNLLRDDQEAVNKFITVGNVLLNAQAERVKKAFDRGVDFNFHELKARLVNTTGDISEIGEFIYTKSEYDIAVMWQAIGDMVVVSLRSNTADCAKLAERYGGGGHKGAAGFQIKDQNFSMLFFGETLAQIGCQVKGYDPDYCKTCPLNDSKDCCTQYRKNSDCKPIYE